MKNKVYRNCLLALPVLATITVLYRLGILFPTRLLPDCFFHKITGFSCPGCGCTRSAQALMRGDLIQSLKLNPSVLYMTVIYCAYVLSHTAELFISFGAKKLPSLFREGSPLHILTHIHGMKERELYLYILIVLLLTFGVIRFFFELGSRIHLL